MAKSISPVRIMCLCIVVLLIGRCIMYFDVYCFAYAAYREGIGISFGILFIGSLALVGGIHVVIGRGMRNLGYEDQSLFLAPERTPLPAQEAPPVFLSMFTIGVTVSNILYRGRLVQSLVIPCTFNPSIQHFPIILTLLGLPASSFLAGGSVLTGVICSLLNFSIGFLGRPG